VPSLPSFLHSFPIYLAIDLVAQVSGDVFVNLLHRDLQFHLERKIGTLGRVIDRGGRSINSALTTMLFHVVPTTLEIGKPCWVLPSFFPWVHHSSSSSML
jgi:ABC-type transport system involved in Fe-S cluster assembly fused permease/ATPase subunit